MRVAILTSFLYHDVKEVGGKDRIIWGGAERYLYELCKLMQSEGHEVTVYQSLNQNTTSGGQSVRVNCGQVKKDLDGIPVICLPDTDKGWGTLNTNSGLNMVFNELSIYHDLSIYFATFLAYPYAVRPSISISHGIFWDYPQHQSMALGEDGKREFFKRQLYGFTATDICVAVDSNVRKSIAAMNPGGESNIRTIYNFVDTNSFTPNKNKDWDTIRVLYPRRLTQLRGCNDFIKASQKYPVYDYLAVGQSGSEETEKAVVGWGKTTEQIRFITSPMEKMPEIYQKSDIAVIPTKASEGLSLSLLEAMSCGLPVITTPVGGLGDAVIPCYNSLIYDPIYDDLGEFINILAENEELRDKFGARNREIAVESFDISIWKSQWKGLLKSFGG